MYGSSPACDGGFDRRASSPAAAEEAADFYLERIRECVFRLSRLHFEGHRKRVFRQRLEARLQQLGVAGFRSYWELLQRERSEQARLLDLLTTNETFFFRNPEQFRHLREAILPGLELARGQAALRSLARSGEWQGRSRMKLRILCAGCSTGEEPYSVAMTVLETLRYPKAWDIEIVAGDLSESCLEAARAGFYQTARLKGLAPELMDRYLTAQPGGAVVRDELRELVKFQSLNLGDLMKGELPAGFSWGGFDIIFCRNVMIYFSPSCQQLLVETLYRLLAPEGYLFTGDAEPLHLFSHDFAALRDAGCLIYHKTRDHRRIA